MLVEIDRFERAKSKCRELNAKYPEWIHFVGLRYNIVKIRRPHLHE